MTATMDRLDTPATTDEPPRPRRRHAIPPGSEAMAKPWRLAIAFVGVTIGLLARLLVANGVGSLTAEPLLFAAAASSALVGAGLLALAAERDRFGMSLMTLAVACSLALSALQWISPHFPGDTFEWSTEIQRALAALGAGNGLLLAGIIALAFVRRSATATVAAALGAGALILASNSVLVRHEWAAILTTGAAFGALLVAWDQAPRHEPIFRPGDGSPRSSRAVLSLATVAICGAALQLWISRDEDGIGRAGPAVGAAIVLLVVAFLALARLRREIQRRSTTLSEWTAWMREIRTGELRSDLERYGDDEDPRLGDLTAEPPRPLSFPDLRLGHGPHTELEVPDAETGAAASGPLVVPLRRTAQDRTWSDLVREPPRDTAPRHDAVQPAAPTPAAGPPSAGAGPFSAATRSMPVGTLDDFRRWLGRSSPDERVVLAVEAMALVDYDTLPPEVRAAATAALVDALAGSGPAPTVVAPVDGPYVLAGFDAADLATMMAIHRRADRLVRQPIETTEGPVGLTGAVSLVRPAARATLDDVIDAAIAGLVQAHRARHEAGRR